MSSYIELARELPVPTTEQTRQFAEYVTSAHSWYKHLPLLETCPFAFYLDPNAGRAMIDTPEGEVTFVDHVDTSTRFHYTWQLTADYRRRFGFWNYDAPYGRSFRYHSNAGAINTAGPGLRILSAGGEWLSVPEALVLAGTAHVSSLMSCVGFVADEPIWRESRIRMIFNFIPSFSSPPDNELLTKLAELASAWPEDIAAAFRVLVALWTGETYGREHAPVTRRFDAGVEESRDLDAAFEVMGRHINGAYKRAFEEALQAPFLDLHEQAQQAWEMTESRRRERQLIEQLFGAVERERQRQIEGMVAAMNRFIASLHAHA